MSIDLYAKSQQLLESLANSIHDREPKTLEPFCFSMQEIYLTERWLKGLMQEIETHSKK